MVAFASSNPGSHSGSKGVVIDGVDQVVRQFMRGAIVAIPAAGLAAVASAAKTADRMKSHVPIGPPTLHVLNSITADHTPTINGGTVYADAGPDSRADGGAFVGRFLEHGTIHMAPKPFVGPAGDQTLPEFIDAIKKLPDL